MPIIINNSVIEDRLAKLGQRQPIPVKKTAMAMAILLAATADDRGAPTSQWKKRSRKHSHPSKTDAA